jgi:hypothetical protein
MTWLVYDSETGGATSITHSPFIIGRGSGCDLKLASATVSRQHLQVVQHKKSLDLINLSEDNATLLRGVPFQTYSLDPKYVAVVSLGNVTLIFTVEGVDVSELLRKYSRDATEYFFSTDGVDHGPYTRSQLLEEVTAGVLRPDSLFWIYGRDDEKVMACDVEGLEFPAAVSTFDSPSAGDAYMDYVPADGEGFMCPYCRHVAALESLLAVAVDPAMHGDPVLGNDEQQRFLPTRLTPDGFAIDAGGYKCPEIACPKCHMILPPAVVNQPLHIMSVVGATAAGKSYFLASAVWHMRSVLPSKFGMGFMDVDPRINQWINEYEEKLFFQEDDENLQVIEKNAAALLAGLQVGKPERKQCVSVAAQPF